MGHPVCTEINGVQSFGVDLKHLFLNIDAVCLLARSNPPERFTHNHDWSVVPMDLSISVWQFEDSLVQTHNSLILNTRACSPLRAESIYNRVSRFVLFYNPVFPWQIKCIVY